MSNLEKTNVYPKYVFDVVQYRLLRCHKNNENMELIPYGVRKISIGLKRVKPISIYTFDDFMDFVGCGILQPASKDTTGNEFEDLVLHIPHKIKCKYDNYHNFGIKFVLGDRDGKNN